MKEGLRFAVIGAGAAGLSAADALTRLGHRVTVLEREPDRVGGKCRTISIDGAPRETGAIFVLPNYPIVSALADRVGVKRTRAARFVHQDAAGRRRPFGRPAHPISIFSKAAEYLRLGLQLVKHRHLLDRPLDEADPADLRALSLPLTQWMDQHRLRFFRSSPFPLLRSFGFGFEEQDIPTVYIFQILPFLARGGNLLTLWDVEGTDLDVVREGYGEIWRRVAADLDVRLGARIQSVTRTSSGVRVRTETEELTFDKLIVTSPLDEALAFLDASPEERRLFDRIRWLHVWQAVVRIEGLPDALILDENQTYARIGRPMILFRYGADTDRYYVFGYCTETADDASIEAAIAHDLPAAGGRILAPPSLLRWKYFPHFSSTDIAAGALSDLAALQGRRDTWYAGEAVANIGVESVTSHAQRLVQRTWGTR